MSCRGQWLRLQIVLSSQRYISHTVVSVSSSTHTIPSTTTPSNSTSVKMMSSNNTTGTTGHSTTGTGHPSTGHSTTGIGHSAGTTGHTGTGIGHSGTTGHTGTGHSTTGHSMTGNSSEPSKMSGQMHAAKGGVKETVGKTFGATNMKFEGAQERAAGHAEKEAAKTGSYAQGTAERAAGKKDQFVGGMTGDYSQQRAGDVRHKQGEFQQDMNRY
ncbi:hypothetical protein BKA70DRAFT_1246411 [Coprinopsis sp. MPI-PUGE-AT-0042]|nr:hypothetical protein BKA70DRAFT_1246411 [Coprinopsis sp. MPI-PUGE-AT-0042]